MDIEEKLTYYLTGLTNQLKDVEEQMILALCELFNGDYLELKQGNTIQEVDTFYFEYDYETLDIVVWAEDKEEEVISTLSREIPNDLGDSLFPRELEMSLGDLEEEWGETEDGEEAFQELIDKWAEQKDVVLTKWFKECWDISKQQTQCSIKGKFSIHDTIYRTSL
jgi:hypothetical protein